MYKGSASESGFFGFLEAADALTFGALALHFRLSQLFRRRICETAFSYGFSCVIGPIRLKIAFATVNMRTTYSTYLCMYFENGRFLEFDRFCNCAPKS